MLGVVNWNINENWKPLQSLGCQVPSNCPMALRHILEELDADIVCLQGTKVTRDALSEPLAVVEGYNSHCSFSHSWSDCSGVTTFCITLNQDVGCYGNMPEFTQEQLQALDSEGPALLTQHKICMREGKEKPLSLMNVYCLHTDPGKPEQLADL